MNKAFLWAALVLAPALTHAAAVGTMFGGPFIYGRIRTGDFEKVQQDFAKGLSKPMEIKIDADSNPFETMRIGLWMAEKRPPLEVRRQCVGACASFLLTSASSVRIDKGTLIAFSTREEQPALVFDHLRANPDALFVENNEISQLSRARLLQRFKLAADSSALMRDAADRLVPAAPLKFLRALTQPDVLDKVAFDEERAHFDLQFAPGRCYWWVPDAAGLAQLGIDARGYQPVDREAAAKLLKVEPRFVYVGPAVDPMPEGGLCTKP